MSNDPPPPANELTLHPIQGVHDPNLLPWFDLYQDAFPLPEQMRISSVLRALAKMEAGDTCIAFRHFAVESAEGAQFAGLAWYQLESESVAYLWYLAVATNLRSQGLGSRAYRLLVEELQTRGIRILLYEIEHPEDPQAEAKMALRRRGFYQRNGAWCAVNVPYTQSVGWQPPMRMWLMAHSLTPDVTETEMTTALYQAFAENAEPVDRVEWV